MSNVYITEPPTSGKVLLKTTVGDIDIELWAKETPKACRNFIQLCLEGYYNNTIFHRLVKGFIVQGGDPKGDGTGGESIYGETFKDEFHSRLRFSRRGIVAMANAGKDDNGSQFFFTLAATPELQNVHTIFGKITGETIFNMLKLEEGLVEHERPVYPHKILKTEVLNNPFPDIEPRILKKEEHEEKKKKDRKPGVKNFKLLSFGAEAEEDEEEASVANQEFVGKGKSTHDLLDDPKLSTKTVVQATVEEEKDEESEESEIDHEEELENIRNKLKPDKRKPTTSYYLNKDEKEARKRKAEEIREEIIKVKKEYKKNKLVLEAVKEEEIKKKEMSETFKEYQEEFDKYKDKKKSLPKKGKIREDFTLSLLDKFKKKLESVKDKLDEESENYEEKPENKEEKTKKKDEDSDPEDTSWMAHKLKFASNEAVLARDANTKGDDWYEVYDPRNPLNKRRREESKKNLTQKVGNKR